MKRLLCGDYGQARALAGPPHPKETDDDRGLAENDSAASPAACSAPPSSPCTPLQRPARSRFAKARACRVRSDRVGSSWDHVTPKYLPSLERTWRPGHVLHHDYTGTRAVAIVDETFAAEVSSRRGPHRHARLDLPKERH